MRKTAVVVAIAKLGEPAVVASYTGGGSFVGTGRAMSAAAGRLSYFYGLKVPHVPSLDAIESLWPSDEMKGAARHSHSRGRNCAR